jgi:hypothetical protein
VLTRLVQSAHETIWKQVGQHRDHSIGNANSAPPVPFDDAADAEQAHGKRQECEHLSQTDVFEKLKRNCQRRQ